MRTRNSSFFSALGSTPFRLPASGEDAKENAITGRPTYGPELVNRAVVQKPKRIGRALAPRRAVQRGR